MVNLQKGLVGHWTFDAGATNNSTAYDSSAYDNHASAANSPKFNESAILNEGVLINAKDQYFEIDPLDTSDISISLWYRYDGVGSNWNTILGDGNGGDHHLLIDSTGSGDIGFYNSSFYNSGYTLTEGEWYHIVIIKSGTNQKMYINNDLKQDSNNSFDNSSSNNSFETIANYGPGNNQGSLGIIDDIRAYNRTLSENEVRALYNMRSQRQQNAIGLPHTQNLLLHLNARNKLSVDESNNRWYDISGNNYEAHGTDGNGSINDNNFPDWEAKNGGRFILNGSEGWNVPGPIDTSGQVTLESWFYRTDLSADPEYLSDARNGTGDWYLINYQGYNVNFHNDLEMNDPSGGDYRDTGATSSPSSNLFNRWTHLVATSDGNISEIYIDGEKITDSRLQRDNPFPTGIGKDFAIANRYTGQSHLQGYMSVYRIYDDVLTPAQVKSNYESEKIYYK